MKLRVLTNSAMRVFRRCPREYYYAFELAYRPVSRDVESLRFGTAIHLGLEAWWLGRGVEAAVDAATAAAADPYEAARLRVLLRGYDARWSGESYAVAGVEVEFRAPLVNPATGAASKTFMLGGKIDVLLERGLIEHKTAGTEIGLGSVYWQKLVLDSQVSTYYAGAKSLGHEVDRCVYDVIKKPAIRPYRATPEESRKYTKDGRLYANQREDDESVEEYEARLTEEVAASPDRYYQRGEVVRLESEVQDAQFDAWQLARLLRDSELANRFPRNVDACERWSRLCEYFPICSGTASLDDTTRYERVENIHPELSAETAA